MGSNKIFLAVSTVVIVGVIIYLIFGSGGFNPKDISGSLMEGIQKDSVSEEIPERDEIDLNEEVDKLLVDEDFQVLMKDEDFKELLVSQEFKELSENPAFKELMKKEAFWELLKSDKLKELESEIDH